MKNAAIFTQVRHILQDSVEPYRNSKALLVSTLNLALADVWRVRPDLFFGRYASGAPEFDVTAPDTVETEDFPLHVQWASPVISFMAGWIELSDDEFTTDGRSAILQQRFITTLTVGG